MKTVETVRGAVATDQLHSVLMHEHICTSSMGIATHYPQFYVSDYEERIIREIPLSYNVSEGEMLVQLQSAFRDFTKEDMERLRDEGTLIDGKFYLYGRPDAHRPGRGIETRKTPDEITAGLDKDKPIIVLDHQPKELQELADAGVDIDLCGHTHDGQMFPGNLTIKLMWENACGYLQKGKMHNIVTSGVGLFGPNMRVGTKAEICPITIHFAKN